MSDLTAVSLFAGIGGIDRALELAGVQVTAAVEIDPDCRGVLRRHFPGTAIFNDVTEVTGDQLRATGFVPGRGILAGGFPCQGLSVAGRRKGLADARSGLFWHVMRLADELRPRWLLLENVPGLLSSVCPCPGDDSCVDNGRVVECGEWRAEPIPSPADDFYARDDCPVCSHPWDVHDAGGFCSPCQDTCEGLPEQKWRKVFIPNVPHNIKGGACPAGCMAAHGGAMGTVLGALGERGYGFAYRVLDAQFFGVPQRRRRVFIAGCLGDRAAPVQVLLEPESGEGHPAQGGQERPRTAAAPGWGAVSSLQGGGRRGHRIDAEGAAGGQLVPAIALPLVSGGNDRHDESQMTYVTAPTITAGWGTNHGAPGHGGKDEAVLAVAHALTAREAKDPDSDAVSGFIVVPVALRGRDEGGQIEAGKPGEPAFTVRTPGGGSSYPMVAHALTSEGADASEDGTGRGTPLVAVPVSWRGRGMEAGEENIANALRSAGDGHVGDQMGYVMSLAVAGDFSAGENVAQAVRAPHGQPGVIAAGFTENQRGEVVESAVSHQLTTGGGKPGQGYLAVRQESTVRRLTPMECERLQGFPDRWTLHQADGREQSDSTRYRQLGNSVAVPCVEWITRRLVAADTALSETRGAA